MCTRRALAALIPVAITVCCGIAAELAARIAEEGFDKLKAPIRRVTTPDVPVPFSPPLEEFITPSEARIAEAIHTVLRI